jgi:hypothetical protein
MKESERQNRRKVQVRNYWAYNNRRKIPQSQGGYDDVCHCGKAVAYCPDCLGLPESESPAADGSESIE